MTLLVTTPAAAPVTIVVANAVELKAALAAATGGETIILKPGNYGAVSMTAGKDVPATYDSPVNIMSADPDAQAVITGLDLNGVNNIAFRNVVFDYEADPGAPRSQSPFSLDSVSDIKFIKCTFDGDLAEGTGTPDDGFGTGNGLTVQNSDGIVIRNCEFFDWYRAANFGETQNIVIIGNNIHHISSDGLDFADVDQVLIKGNRIHDFERSPLSAAHSDMIQFWTKGTTTPSTGIKILNNILDQGDGASTQSIFMRNDLVDTGAAGLSMYYQNIEIAGNIIRNSQYHGITVGETIGLSVHHNTVIQSLSSTQGGGGSTPSINIAPSSLLVTVTDNLMPMIGADLRDPLGGWIVGNNHIVQIDNPNAQNFLGHLFADAMGGGVLRFQDMVTAPGGLVESWGAGATLWKPAGTFGTILSHDTSSGGFIVQNLDCSNIFVNGVAINLAGATATWNFGDGTTGSGLAVGHVYAQPGEYTAQAVIVLAGGQTLTLSKTFTVQSPNFLDVDFSKGVVDQSPFLNVATLNGATVEKLADGNSALRLNGGTVAYKSNSDFVFNDAFTLLVDFKKDAGEETAGGSLIYKTGSLVVKLGGDSVSVIINTSKGPVNLSASAIGISDTDWHRLAVTFSGETGVAKLFIDGVVVDLQGGLIGAVEIGDLRSALHIGGPFGDSFGGLIDNVHFIGEAMSGANVRAADPITSWETSGGQLSTVVSDYLDGFNYTNLNSFMLPVEIDLLFSNVYNSLLTDTDFQII